MLIGRSGRDNGVASQGCRAATFTLSADSPRKFAWSLVEVVGSQREKGRRDASRRWVQQQRRHRGREGERRPRDLRALLASNSKRARATCLEYSLVIFPSGHPPVSLFSLPFSSLLFSSLLFSSFLISFLLSVRLTPERYFICKAAACRLPLLLLILCAQECLLASSKISCYQTMTAPERGIKRRRGTDQVKYILFDFYFRFVSFVRFFDGFISRLVSLTVSLRRRRSPFSSLFLPFFFLFLLVERRACFAAHLTRQNRTSNSFNGILNASSPLQRAAVFAS